MKEVPSRNGSLLWRIFLRFRFSSGLRSSFLRYLRAAAYTFNLHTLLMLVVALMSVYFCLVWDIHWNMDFSLVATGTVFPLTYTISQAYTRRERATILVANLKASVVALYYMHRDWDQSENYPASLGNDQSPWALKVKVLLVELLVATRRFLTCRNDEFESVAEQRLTIKKNELLELFEHDVNLSTSKNRQLVKALRQLQSQDPANAHLADCYRALSMLSVMNEQLTIKSGYTRGGEGGLSRTNQYLRYIISNIEELRMIKQYRTPAMMRHACSLLFHIFAVLLAPYFTHFCDSWIAQGYEETSCPQGYVGASFYVLIVMILLHCEQDLEDCFAETGLDDVFFVLHEEVDAMIHTEKILLSECPSLDTMAAGMYHTSSHEALGGHSPPVAGRGSHYGVAGSSARTGGAGNGLPTGNGMGGQPPSAGGPLPGPHPQVGATSPESAFLAYSQQVSMENGMGLRSVGAEVPRSSLSSGGLHTIHSGSLLEEPGPGAPLPTELDEERRALLRNHAA